MINWLRVQSKSKQQCQKYCKKMCKCQKFFVFEGTLSQTTTKNGTTSLALFLHVSMHFHSKGHLARAYSCTCAFCYNIWITRRYTNFQLPIKIIFGIYSYIGIYFQYVILTIKSGHVVENSNFHIVFIASFNILTHFIFTFNIYAISHHSSDF